MTITSKLKNPPEARLREEIPTFKECYLAAFMGLHAGFDSRRCNYYEESEEADDSAQFFAKMAWKSAKEARKLFKEEKIIQEFNQKITHNAKLISTAGRKSAEWRMAHVTV
jgi:hypothetical protein